MLGIVLRDSLHQTQYVEKLEKIIRFLIREKALTLQDLDAVWRAQDGKHETIVKNVHDLLAKLAWDFNSEQLDHLFDCFEVSAVDFCPSVVCNLNTVFFRRACRAQANVNVTVCWS